MSTVDASGAIHGSDGRFAGHVAGESTAELPATDTADHDQVIESAYVESLEHDRAVDAAWSRVNHATSDADSAAFDYHRSVARAAFPEATGLKLNRDHHDGDWRVSYVDDRGRQVPMAGGSQQVDYFYNGTLGDTDKQIADYFDEGTVGMARFSDGSGWMKANAITRDARELRIPFAKVDENRDKEARRHAEATPGRPSGCPDFGSGCQNVLTSIEDRAASGAYEDYVGYDNDHEFAQQVYDVYQDIEAYDGVGLYKDAHMSVDFDFRREGAHVGVSRRDKGTGLWVTHSEFHDTFALTDDEHATGADQAEAIARKLHALFDEAFIASAPKENY